MKISEKEAKELCNSVEIKLVQDSFPEKIKQLSPKKITTRLKNSIKAEDYWKKRYEELSEDLNEKKKNGKIVPLLPEIKMDTFKRKSLLFRECSERFKKELINLEKKSKITKSRPKQ